LGLEEFSVKVDVHQRSVLLLFASVVDAITKDTNEGLLNETSYTDDLVLVSETRKDCG